MKKITKIEKYAQLAERPKLLRVAAYARVSTDEEKQQNSLQAQTDYYRSLISSNGEWVFAGVYADNGISGLSYQNRDAFKQMIADCDAGKIDMIITKSISRFARNTVDTIKIIRHLKELGIGVKFEKEGIWSLDGKGEFVLTLMASFAQEESRSISENVLWGLKKYFADGNYYVAYGGFLGYGKGFVIEEDGAQTVRLIYKYYLQGYSSFMIARMLQEQGYPTARTGEHKWSHGIVQSILSNEKYKGDALTQKTYLVSFITKKRVPNNGEVERHYITGGHEAIIPPVIFDYVQEITESRKNIPDRYSGLSLFTSKFICSRCGEKFRAKIIHSNDKYRHNLWQCQNRFRKGAHCKNRFFNENELPELMNTMFSAIANRQPEIKRTLLPIIEDVVGKERMKDIRKFISAFPADKLSTDAEEWAMLVENIIVYDKTLKVRLFGGIEITIRR